MSWSSRNTLNLPVVPLLRNEGLLMYRPRLLERADPVEQTQRTFVFQFHGLALPMPRARRTSLLDFGKIQMLSPSNRLRSSDFST